jgi:hypothetical protein
MPSPHAIAVSTVITPGLIEFYKKRAHELRAECHRDMLREVWALLARIGRRRAPGSYSMSSPPSIIS